MATPRKRRMTKLLRVENALSQKIVNQELEIKEEMKSVEIAPSPKKKVTPKKTKSTPKEEPKETLDDNPLPDLEILSEIENQ